MIALHRAPTQSQCLLAVLSVTAVMLMPSVADARGGGGGHGSFHHTARPQHQDHRYPGSTRPQTQDHRPRRPQFPGQRPPIINPGNPVQPTPR